MIPFGVIQPSPLSIDTLYLQFILPALGFVALYSNLGHKEVRFLYPALPLFNIAAAAGWNRLFEGAFITFKDKRPPRLTKLAFVVSCVGVLASTGLSWMYIVVASSNYPGGNALHYLTLHVQDTGIAHVNLFVDVAASMTGVSNFGLRQAQRHGEWTVSKAGYEHETPSFDAFTHIITETPGIDGFHTLYAAQGNPRLDLRNMKIETTEAIFVLERDA